METQIEKTEVIEKAEHSNKTKPTTIIIIALLAVLIILVAVFLVTSLRDDNEPVQASAPGVGLSIDTNAGEYVAPEPVAAVAPQGVAIPGWGSIKIAKDTTDVTVSFFNPEANKDLYYLTFELRLMEENGEDYEVLYTSGLVEPGLYLQHITLNRPLAAGEYDAVIHVQPYRMDEARTPTNNADMATVLIVE